MLYATFGQFTLMDYVYTTIMALAAYGQIYSLLPKSPRGEIRVLCKWYDTVMLKKTI